MEDTQAMFPQLFHSYLYFLKYPNNTQQMREVLPTHCPSVFSKIEFNGYTKSASHISITTAVSFRTILLAKVTCTLYYQYKGRVLNLGST